MEKHKKKTLAAGVGLGLWAVITPLMRRDLRRRAPEQTRGPQWLWRMASANLSGSVAYWLFGRKSPDRSASRSPQPNALSDDVG